MLEVRAYVHSLNVITYSSVYSLWCTVLLILLTALHTLGCGTLGGADQIVSIDSAYRGEKVYLRDGTYLGTTPFFSKVIPEPRLTLMTRRGLSYDRHPFECRFRWLQSPLENAPLALVGAPLMSGTPIGPALGGLGFAMGGVIWDTVEGAAFRCPPQFFLNTTASSAKVALSCAIQTPMETGMETRSALIRAWRRTHEGQSECDSVVELGKMLESARTLKLPKDLADITKSERARVYRFGYQTGASQLIILSVPKSIEATDHGERERDTPREVQVTPAEATAQSVDVLARSAPFTVRLRQLDLHRLEVQKDEPITLHLPKGIIDKIQSDPLESYLRRSFYLIPDAISVGAGIIEAGGEGFDAQARITPFTLNKVSHPSGFDRWDYELSIAPELSLDIFSNELELEAIPKTGIDTVVFRRFSGAALVSIEGHTPIGALGFGVKTGLMYLSSSRPDDSDASMMMGMRLRHTAFLSQQVFCRTTFHGEYIKLDLGPHRFTSMRRVVVSLGYHWAGLEGLVRSWF